MYKRTVVITEDNDFLNILQKVVQEDYDVIKNVQFHIDFVKRDYQLVVLIAGLPSVKSKIDEFANHLERDYK